MALGTSVVIALGVNQIAQIVHGLPNEDYFYFRESARMLVSGVSPYARPRLFYPLYTVIWLFVPLLAGDWTRWIWTFAPLLFLHLALGRKAVVLWPFYPVLVHMRFGQVDGWLILPVLFLLRKSEKLAPVSAALILLKPQSAWGLLLYRLAQWTRQGTWRSLALFAGAGVILVVPAFLIRFDWFPEWLHSVSVHPPEACQNATLWGWLCFGSEWLPFALIEGLLALLLSLRTSDKASALQLCGMLFTPILYAYDYILVALTLRSTRECVLLLVVSWLAVGVDILAGGWGGAYSVIPLVALALRADILPQRIFLAKPAEAKLHA